MDWLKLIQALVPVAVTVAESIHPLGGSGAAKLSAATTIVQTGLGIAAGAGAIPPQVAIDTATIVSQINQHVAAANAAGGVSTVGGK